jgi:hypothetical protein
MALVGLLSIAFIAAGCGDDTSVTKAEFIEQADAVCKKTEKQKQTGIEDFLSKADAGPTNPLTAKQSTELERDAVLPALQRQVEELNALDVPDGGAESKTSAILEEFEKAVEEVEKDPAILASKTDPFTKAAKLAGEYGFKTCILYY